MSDDPGVSAGGDTFREVSEQSWLGRLFGSFVAVLIGLVLFVASFPLLYWNEGRAVAAIIALKAGASSVISVPAETVDAANEGKLVHVSGMASAGAGATDPLFRIGSPTALRLRRHVEMYQWQEHSETTTEKRVGGGETKTTTYSYTKAWSDTRSDSSLFKNPAGHANPPISPPGIVTNAVVRVGAFRLDKALLDEVSAFTPLDLPGDAAAGAPGFRRDGGGFYRGASADNPAVGDVRVSFETVEAQPLSVVAAQMGQGLAPFRSANGRMIGLVDAGTRSADEMFREAQASEATLTWILRGAGFVAMLVGLALTAAPIAWLASVLPFLEGVVDAAAVFAALILAVPLTLFTIAIAWVAHRPLIGIGLIAAGLVLGYGLRLILPRRRVAMAA